MAVRRASNGFLHRALAKTWLHSWEIFCRVGMLQHQAYQKLRLCSVTSWMYHILAPGLKNFGNTLQWRSLRRDRTSAKGTAISPKTAPSDRVQTVVPPITTSTSPRWRMYIPQRVPHSSWPSMSHVNIFVLFRVPKSCHSRLVVSTHPKNISFWFISSHVGWKEHDWKQKTDHVKVSQTCLRNTSC